MFFFILPPIHVSLIPFLTDGPDPIRHAYNNLIFPFLNMATLKPLPLYLAWTRNNIGFKKENQRFEEGASPHLRNLKTPFIITSKIAKYQNTTVLSHIYKHPSELGFPRQNSTVAGYRDTL